MGVESDTGKPLFSSNDRERLRFKDHGQFSADQRVTAGQERNTNHGMYELDDGRSLNPAKSCVNQ